MYILILSSNVNILSTADIMSSNIKSTFSTMEEQNPKILEVDTAFQAQGKLYKLNKDQEKEFIETQAATLRDVF